MRKTMRNLARIVAVYLLTLAGYHEDAIAFFRTRIP
jgi:hypothetical protein